MSNIPLNTNETVVENTRKFPSTSNEGTWLTLLKYPALAIAVIGAVPAYYKMFENIVENIVAHLPYEVTRTEREISKIWSRNIDCVDEAQRQFVTSTFDKAKLSLRICKSGDVLLTSNPDTPAAIMRWVVFDSNEKLTLGKIDFLSTAYANESSPIRLAQLGEGADESVMCQRWIKEGVRLVRRVRSPSGCFDVTINALTNAIESRVQVPCDKTCA